MIWTHSTEDLMRLGNWLAQKARRQAARQGTQAAARNLRKQGVPLSLAVRILARKEAA